MKNIWALAGRILYILIWPGLYLILRNTERTRVVVSCGGSVLLVKDWLGDGSWKLPGGGIHGNEDPAQAALRELKEESSIDAQETDLKPISEIAAHGHGIPIKLYCYSLAVQNKVAVHSPGAEILDVRWVALDRLGQLKLTKDTRTILSLWRRRGI